MSELSINRTPDLIAAEINDIKEQTRRQVLYNSIEIGRRLTEAKLLVGHGEWGKWLEEKVDYSKSTANNLMKIFEEYGADQISLIGNNAKSQAIGELSYTQAITLLGIHDSGEREKFVENNNIDEMSTRQLKKAIEDLKKTKSEKEYLEKELKDLKSKSKAEKDKLKEDVKKKEKIAKELTEESNKLLESLNEKEKETSVVRKELQECYSKIKELEEKPIDVITDGVDEEKIKEIEEAHKKEIEILMGQKEEIENKLKDLEKNSAKHNENVVKYRLHFDKLTAGFKEILVDVDNIKKVDPEEAQKYVNACKTLISMMSERL